MGEVLDKILALLGLIYLVPAVTLSVVIGLRGEIQVLPAYFATIMGLYVSSGVLCILSILLKYFKSPRARPLGIISLYYVVAVFLMHVSSLFAYAPYHSLVDYEMFTLLFLFTPIGLLNTLIAIAIIIYVSVRSRT